MFIQEYRLLPLYQVFIKSQELSRPVIISYKDEYYTRLSVEGSVQIQNVLLVLTILTNGLGAPFAHIANLLPMVGSNTIVGANASRVSAITAVRSMVLRSDCTRVSVAKAGQRIEKKK